MNFARAWFAMAAAFSVASGTTLSPYYQFELILGRAVNATRSESLGGIAMQLLRDVAEGHPDRVTPENGKLLGLQPEQVQLLANAFAKDPGVRAIAYRAMGRTGLPEALEYLQALKPAQVGNLGPGDSHEAWPAAQLALQEARLMQLKTPEEQAAFLENAATTSFDSYSTGTINFWATQKLCNMGSWKSLPLIEARLRSLYSRIGEAEIGFCRERMQVVQRDENRARALGSVLNVGTSGAAERLSGWAITELGDMNSAEADAELDRFYGEIEVLQPLGRYPVLVSLAEQIDLIRSVKRYTAMTSQE